MTTTDSLYFETDPIGLKTWTAELNALQAEIDEAANRIADAKKEKNVKSARAGQRLLAELNAALVELKKKRPPRLINERAACGKVLHRCATMLTDYKFEKQAFAVRATVDPEAALEYRASGVIEALEQRRAAIAILRVVKSAVVTAGGTLTMQMVTAAIQKVIDRFARELLDDRYTCSSSSAFSNAIETAKRAAVSKILRYSLSRMFDDAAYFQQVIDADAPMRRLYESARDLAAKAGVRAQ